MQDVTITGPGTLVDAQRGIVRADDDGEITVTFATRMPSRVGYTVMKKSSRIGYTMSPLDILTAAPGYYAVGKARRRSPKRRRLIKTR